MVFKFKWYLDFDLGFVAGSLWESFWNSPVSLMEYFCVFNGILLCL